MTIVLGIRHGFEVLGIAPRTSHIFGWTSSLSREKPWIGRLGLSVDWSYLYTTISEDSRRASQRAFVLPKTIIYPLTTVLLMLYRHLLGRLRWRDCR